MEESEAFREQLKARSEEFVEQVLLPHFGQLIAWVKDAERKLEKGKYFLLPDRLTD